MNASMLCCLGNALSSSPNKVDRSDKRARRRRRSCIRALVAPMRSETYNGRRGFVGLVVIVLIVVHRLRSSIRRWWFDSHRLGVSVVVVVVVRVSCNVVVLLLQIKKRKK